MFSKSPLFGDFMRGFWLVLKDRKGSLIGESDVITLYCQPDQRLHNLFLSFNANQKPCIKSPKVGIWEQNMYRAVTRSFFFLSKYNKRRKSGLATWDYTGRVNSRNKCWGLNRCWPPLRLQGRYSLFKIIFGGTVHEKSWNSTPFLLIIARASK